MISLTRYLALEVAPLGILVNSVAPGPMATETAKQSDWYEAMVAGFPTRHADRARARSPISSRI